MTVPPIPIRSLLPAVRSSKRTILSAILLEVQTIGTVFVFIPIVIVLVVTVVEPVAALLVSTVIFLTSVVLPPGRSTHCRWCNKGCSKKKGTEKISIVTVHHDFLLVGISMPETPARIEYAVSALGAMFDTVHLLRLYEFTPEFGKSRHSDLEKAI
jgi:hypothetical protein